MSYTVFARKYRPQRFEEVLGQEHITRTLTNAIDQQRIAHAYIFVGPRGTGKTSTARIFAMALNCTGGPKADFDPHDEACEEIAQGRSLDVIEIDGASNNGVEQVRELRENVRFAPARGRFKIYIIDEVHMLTTAAFNALLKTLEEPPPHAKFLMATTDVQKVLPTILSRCQRFDLRRIPTATIARHLLSMAEQEKFVLEPAAAEAVARGAEGGLRDAESMLDQLVAFCGDTITEQDVLNIFGFTAHRALAELCSAILAGDAPVALHAVHEHGEAGKDLGRLLSDLISHLRNLLVLKADPAGLGEELMPEEIAILQEQANLASMDKLLELIEQFALAEGRMKWAANKKMHFEVAVIRAIQTLQSATLTEVLETLTAIRGGAAAAAERRAPAASASSPASPSKPVAARPIAEPPKSPRVEPTPEARVEVPKVEVPKAEMPRASGPRIEVMEVEPEKIVPVGSRVRATPPPTVTPADTSPAPQKAKPAVAPAKVAEDAPALRPVESPAAAPEISATNFWPEFVESVRRDRKLISAWLEAGVLVGIDAKTVTIGFPPEQSFAKDFLEGSHLAFLEESASHLLGHRVSLKMQIREGVVAVPVATAPPPVVRDPMDEFKDDILIRKALDEFKGRLEIL